MASRSDQVPLLNQQGDAEDENPDVRFTIDDETGAYGEPSRSSDERNAHKYPPAAPPPSYKEATGKSALSLKVSQLFSALSAPDLSILQHALYKIWSFICRFWPTSRFAQVGMFMAGLWLLIIVSGPAFDEAGPRAGAGYPWVGVQQLSESGPGPISGDGHITSYANWTLESCQNSKAHRGDVVCHSTTKIELDIPTGFHSTESIFVYADPPRQNQLSEGRGHVPGTIEVKLVPEGTGPGQTPKGKATVVVDAEFEQSRMEVFEKSTVAKLASGLVTQGVGIYTYPLPAKYVNRNPPPLLMRIQILIPAGATVAALNVQASAMSIGGFVEPEMILTHQESRALQPAHAKRDQLAHPYFGRFILQSGVTPVRIGANVPIQALGVVKVTTYNGDIIIDSNINSGEVRFETMTGSIRLEENSQVTAWRESRLISQTGNIELKRNSWFDSSYILAKTNNGNILGGGKDHAGSKDGGIWKTNKTIEMYTSNGAIHASYAVRLPTDSFLNPTKNVRVETESKNGGVDVVFVDHEKGTGLQAKLTTSVGIVFARMHKAFVGKWQLEGSLSGSGMTPPPSKDQRGFKSIERSKDVIRLQEHGTIGPQDSEAAKDSSVLIRSSLGGAQLSFD
ncbi:uncharacterized protein FA14DRAFT_188258 [Meira miltonrushii]|uniref:Uncharacterized protein n=1 Tax=Meira miltonrushii TaxID=1280837 RepID=A0A316VL15_9BASI|nr:uncharacterized protein FA14DRAFT_188258 [Meira miltonrushii]PWN38246.1 hypothetical protein FA14DRAFT_188258 [Meira miltonrushii]